jgi:hypothetical protein
MHSRRVKRTGYPRGPSVIKDPNGTGAIMNNGYLKLYIDGRQVLAHTYIAEKALGRRLPKGACMHHIDGNRLNNDPHNLVLCPSREYHDLIHKRSKRLGYL